MVLIVVLLVFLAVSLVPARAEPCTTFQSSGEDGTTRFVGKSYDWHFGNGAVLTNARRAVKTAFVWPGQDALSWTSKYASVTFNQYGLEFPNGGMNEEGLVVEILWLRASEYPSVDARPAVNELQWIQWALDTQDSVAALSNAAREVRVSPVYASVHYFACDKGGACAAFEYLDGELVVSSTAGSPPDALANDTYDASARYLAAKAGKSPTGTSSLARFARAALRSSELRKDADVEDAFAVLDGVSQGDYSVWNIVYAPQIGEVYYRTHDADSVRHVNVGALAADCGVPARGLDIQHDATGDVTQGFAVFDDDANSALVQGSMAALGDGPALLTGVMAGYPKRVVCAVK